MSEDDSYMFDDLDADCMQQIEAMEAVHTPDSTASDSTRIPATTNFPSAPPAKTFRPALIPPKPAAAASSKFLPPPPQRQPPAQKDAPHPDSDFDITFDEFDEGQLAAIDDFVVEAYSKPGSTVVNKRQLTLFGDAAVLPEPSKPKSSGSKLAQSTSFGKKAAQTKSWDQTAFAKTGWKRGAKSKKGKGKFDDGEGEEEIEEEEIEFEQFPAPFVSNPSVLVSHWILTCSITLFSPIQPPAMKLKSDPAALHEWIYPLNFPRRDYQFNIVRASLFDNCLVALPTGLGKTFIAGVVMLNYYRWFPKGKVVFVAPTKPLVAQQIEACHQVCGIPGSDAAELTGGKARAIRAREWANKRVFYMTPQTFINDLATENCDPSDIILLVVDEAHKATGDYAYCQIVRYLMAKNPHFRLLALTATPGSTPEAVQEIVDALHISRIEIRDEASLDLRQYLHKKHTVQHIISMTENIIKIREPLAKLMESTLAPLARANVLQVPNVVDLHPYRCTNTMQRLSQQRGGGNMQWAYGSLKNLGAFARAMTYLNEESISLCYKTLQELLEGTPGSAARPPGKAAQSKLRNDVNFKKCIAELEKQIAEAQNGSGVVLHPKMEKLRSLAIEHFAQAEMNDAEEVAAGKEPQKGGSGMIIFAEFRDCVEEITTMLNEQRPLLRAIKFIGQGTDKQGKKGLAQKDQIEIIKRFKAGEFNVLVSTSIGEEGLDIGSVDIIVCYDAQKTPIRMLQRVGRTGRKRDGYVHVLLAEGKEQSNWSKSLDMYSEVQRSIVRGDQLELYGDVKRLLPAECKPECCEKQMEIIEYVPETKGKRKSSELGPDGKVVKRKRNADVNRNIPEGASTGFVSVADLIVKGSRKKKEKPKKFDPKDLEDDDDDLMLEANIGDLLSGKVPKKPTQPDPPPKKSKAGAAARKGKAKATATTAAAAGPSKRKKPVSATVGFINASDLADAAAKSDSDIEVLEKVPEFVRPSRPASSRAMALSTPPSSSDEAVPVRASSARATSTKASHVSFSPSPERLPPSNQSTSTRLSVTLIEEADMAWLLDSDDSDTQARAKIPSPRRLPTVAEDRQSDDELLLVSSPVRPDPSSSFQDSPMSHIPEGHRPRRIGKMAPPSIPPPPRDDDDDDHVEPTFPVRRFGKRAIVIESSSPLVDGDEVPVASQRYLARRSSPLGSPSPSSSPPPSPPRPARRSRPKKKKVDTLLRHAFVEVEANHSGDEVSDGSTDPEGEENEEDRRFAGDFQPTQAPAGYDQRAIYQRSLFTQPPEGLRFRNKPARPGLFSTRGDGGRQLPPIVLSSSPERAGSEPDEYIMDSFVVGDDEDISYFDTSSDV